MVTPSCQTVLTGLFNRIRRLIQSGLSMGLVLFLALATLSVLNQGVEFIQASFTGQMTQGGQPIQAAVPRMRPMTARALYAYGEERFLSGPIEARQMIRESTNLLNSLRLLTHSLERFSH
ncbi:MAG: hypothetical protein COV74_00470 [Candidatus Omnitrophica bacterium CG11_big_fil_rev_8_21_14_0_20_45_26]|uniref:Uncharacterized protein n=1 Tax=Candidatus Abzuiibacterium crystallinum TaxID=1974748 RepID=A0A2H0LT46_9BACT|nr:MAG: hypothetical protein COV74_00470 [Candidatus Omnitrophica bacterium CG11_big_fil_rev_8_21_14_0_20_45_26]PIW65464.1 MAG: hypothetical protein COW12_01820 [Candidatus Omnitrophica bacterium CG12_big_fil_rev_8_21_14_0_65_45_16]